MKNNPEREQKTWYAAKHVSQDVRKNSRSGGVFTAISDCVFPRGYKRKKDT